MVTPPEACRLRVINGHDGGAREQTNRNQRDTDYLDQPAKIPSIESNVILANEGFATENANHFCKPLKARSEFIARFLNGARPLLARLRYKD